MDPAADQSLPVDRAGLGRPGAARARSQQMFSCILGCKPVSKGLVNVNEKVNELRLGFSNTTRNPEGKTKAIATDRADVTTTDGNVM